MSRYNNHKPEMVTSTPPARPELQMPLWNEQQATHNDQHEEGYIQPHSPEIQQTIDAYWL